MYKKVYNDMVKSNLLNDVEIYLLNKEMGKDYKKIVNFVIKHLSIDLIFFRNIICPKCVEEAIKLEQSNYQDYDVLVMLKANTFVSNKEYKLAFKNDDSLLATNYFFERFCNYELSKKKNYKNLTVKQCNDYAKCLTKIKNKEEFLNYLNQI